MSNSNLDKKREKWSGLFMLVFALFYMLLSLKIPETKSQLFDSRFIPILIGCCMILNGLFYSLSVFRNKEEKFEEVNKVKDFDKKTVISTFIAIISYILLYDILGFIISTFIFLIFEINILSPKYVNKNQKLYLIIAGIFSVGLYILFFYGFSIFLPKGILGFI